MINPLIFFVFLQVLDVATTLIVLSMGGSENNPLVAHVMALGPVRGLVVTKTLVIAIAAAGALFKMDRGIRRATVAFCAIVAWNISIIARLAL
jgi:hypothetical protein